VGTARWLFWTGVAVAVVGGVGAGAALARAEEGDSCIFPSTRAERAVHGFGYLAGIGIILIGLAVGMQGVVGERRSPVRIAAAVVIVLVGVSQLVVAYWAVGCDSA
jgi:hypothetical protein